MGKRVSVFLVTMCRAVTVYEEQEDVKRMVDEKRMKIATEASTSTFAPCDENLVFIFTLLFLLLLLLLVVFWISCFK